MKEDQNLEKNTPEKGEKEPVKMGEVFGVPMHIMGDVIMDSGTIALSVMLIILVGTLLNIPTLYAALGAVAVGGLFKIGGDYLKKKARQEEKSFRVSGAVFGYAPASAA